MSVTHRTRATGKFLALLASMTMVLAGVFGIAMAGPAAAAQDVCAGYDSGKIDTKGDPKSVVVNAPQGKLISGYCVKAGSDVSVPGGAVVWVPVSPPAASVTITHPSGKAVSHYALAYTDLPKEYSYSKQVTITKTICATGGTVVNATATGENVAEKKTGADFTTEEKAAIDLRAQGSATTAFNNKYGSYVDGACEGEYAYSKQVTITKTICTASGTIVDATATGTEVAEVKKGEAFTTEEKAAIDALALENAETAFDSKYGTFTEGACSYTYAKQVTITKTICTASGTIVDASATGEEFSDTKSGDDFTTEEKAAIDEKAQDSADAAFSEAHGPFTNGACTDGRGYSYSKQVTVTKSICVSSQQIDNAAAIGDLVSQTRSTDFTADEKSAIDAQATASANAAFAAKYPGFAEGACQPVTVVEPEAATTAAPLPATVPVNAKAPATVAVPAAATVPAAVPAGDGSQAPGLPTWALALIAVGIIGAAAAGRQLVKSN